MACGLELHIARLTLFLFPFGEDFGESGTQEKHHFTSYERDGESGCDYAVNRQYSQSVGRFMRPDPYAGSYSSETPQTLNRCSYVGNDPVNATDPLGLKTYEMCQMESDGCLHCHTETGGHRVICPHDFPDQGGSEWHNYVPPGAYEQPACPDEKRRFFKWLAGPLAKMAKDLNTTLALLLTLAAKEGGWTTKDLDHNEPLNNPFGVNRINGRGRAAGNVDYPSLDAAVEYWEGKFGSRVQGAQTADAFINGLEHPAQGNPYNADIEGYTKEFIKVYDSVLKYMKLCGIQQ